MSYKIKYIARLCDSETDEIIKEQVVHSKTVTFPKSFNEFGLRHKEQVNLIKNSQDFMLNIQCQCFEEVSTCPNCGKKLRKQGRFESEFHDVYTDHKVIISRLTCTCGWKNKYTINGIYGNSTHPELLKLQVTTGANNSFEKASNILNTFCCNKRQVNNDVTIMRNVNRVGEILAKHKQSKDWIQTNEIADEIIMTVDGSHVQYRAEDKHSFEEMISTVYKPEDVIQHTDGRKTITHKISVASAKHDRQYSIKKLTQQACKKLGLTQETKITALTDGAKNCWSVVDTLENECQSLLKILDWFHIGKKFKESEHQIPELLKEKYNKAKWHLWHGHLGTALLRLEQVKSDLTNTIDLEKVAELIQYIKNNQKNIVNYHSRRLNGLSYTSQLAESSVNSVISDRQKNRKMQWSREGAHSILQIRTSIFSNIWYEDWQAVEGKLYQEAA